jgi:hypothetical protein
MASVSLEVVRVSSGSGLVPPLIGGGDDLLHLRQIGVPFGEHESQQCDG